MSEALQLQWPALEELLPLCFNFIEQARGEEGIDLHDAVNNAGRLFGIEDVDEHALAAIEEAVGDGLGQAFDGKDARAVAAIFAAAGDPIMTAVVAFAKGECDAAGFVQSLNAVHLGNISQLQVALQAALGVPEDAASALSGRFGPYLLSIYCLTAAFKIYKRAAHDVQLAKERRIEAERLAAEAVSGLKAERAEMNAVVSAYLLDRLVPFQEGMLAMDRAILDDDDDGYIRANAELWGLFGREAQYSTASEFDDLMLSDEAFRL